MFVSPGLVKPTQLAAALEVSPRSIEKALAALELRYGSGGLRIQRHASGVQLITAPEFAQDVERFLELESTARLTRAAMEALAIVAYQQPVTRPQVDSIRGVNSDSVLRTLLRHGLVEEVDRGHGPGRPILYGTTPEFLQFFGLRSLRDLPPLSLEEGELEVSSQSVPGEVVPEEQ